MEIITLDLNFQKVSQTIASYLIPTSEGPILIETGPHSTAVALEQGLRQHGYAVSEVQHVFLTHIHLDHAGCAWYLAKHGASIYVHPRGLPHLAHPERLMASAKMIYGDQMDVLWGEMNPIPKDQLFAVDNLAEISVGDTVLVAHHTPGHAKHHIAWQAANCLFTGDVAGVKIGEGPIVPPCPPPDIDVETWLESLERIRSLQVDYFYLTHFGKISNTLMHLDGVATVLWNWANWMRPFYEQGTDMSIVVPLFQKYVSKTMTDEGLEVAAVDKYDKANPAWMSVAGLMRYWDKKLAQ